MKNIGDPAEFLKVYDIDKEEALTAAAMARRQTPEGFGEMAKSTDIRAGDDPFHPFTAFSMTMNHPWERQWRTSRVSCPRSFPTT